MFSAVLEALKFLGSAFSGLRDLSDEKRKKFATLCDQISSVLANFVEATRKNKQDFKLCAELKEYVEPLRSLAKGAALSDDINRLAAELDSVCDVWREISEKAGSTGHNFEPDLREVEAGVGAFTGFANRLRAT